MNKIIFAGIILSIWTLATVAQSTRYFVHLLGNPNPNDENALQVKQLSNGSYITVGVNLPTSSGDNYALFLKTDIFGNTTLDSTYIDTSYNINQWKDMIVENNDTLILGGWFENSSDTIARMWIVKADTSGQIYWSSSVGDSVIPSAANCIMKTYDGGYILGGLADDLLSTGHPFGLIVKTNSMGQQLWEQRLDDGNGGWNQFYGMAATPDSGFVFTGQGADLISIAHFLVRFTKVDKNGNVQKDTTYNFSSWNNNVGESISVTNDGGYIIGGYFNDLSHNYSGLLIKINCNFDTVWHKVVVPPQSIYYNSWGFLYKVMVLSDESIVGCGISSDSTALFAYIIKFDSLGNELWRRNFKFAEIPYDDYFYGMDTTSDGGFILCGRSEHDSGAYVPFVKTNCLGFVAPPTASFTDSLGSLSTIYFRNNSENTDTCYWNWGDGSAIQMVRADSTVPVLHHYTTSDSHRVTLTAIACGEVDSISIITPFVTGIAPLSGEEGQGVRLYPNPNDGSFTLNSTLPNSLFQIKDVTGRTVYSTEITGTSGTQMIDVSTLSKGIYYWQLFSNQGISSTGKLAIIK